MTIPKKISLIFFYTAALSAASDYSTLLSKRYNEVTFPCSHNAQSNKGPNTHTIISVQNQEATISEQLNAGIRGMKLPIFEQENNLVACHGINQHVVREVKETIDEKTKNVPKILKKSVEAVAKTVLPSGFSDIYFNPNKVKPCYIDPGMKTFQSILDDVRIFLEQHPTEIVTLFLEIWLKEKATAPQKILDTCKKSGVDTYVFAQKINEQWPLLKDLINTNKRLIIFLDISSDQSKYPFGQYNSGIVWSSPYNFNSFKELKDDNALVYNPNKPRQKGPSNAWCNKTNKIWILQHFVTARTGGSRKDAEQANTKEMIIKRVNNYKKTYTCLENQNPTFIWVDYFNRPEKNGVFDAIDELNGVKK